MRAVETADAEVHDAGRELGAVNEEHVRQSGLGSGSGTTKHCDQRDWYRHNN